MKEQIWFTSRTFKKKQNEATTQQKVSAEDEETAAIESLKSTPIHQQNEEEEPSGWNFRFGKPPKKEECCTDEYVNLYHI